MDNSEEKYLVHFNIISLAGTAKSNGLEAIENAKEGNFEKAQELMEEAQKTLIEAHDMMFKMLQDEANGKPVDMNIIAVHAQDHITMATVVLDLGAEIINLYSKGGR